MIITRQKTFDEIEAMVDDHDYNKIALIGCGGCVAFYHQGGRKETVELAEKLKAGSRDVITGIANRQCYLCREEDVRDLNDADTLKKVSREIEGFDNLDGVEAVISLACGVGVQNLANLVEIPVIPAQNTMFMGKRRVRGDFDIEQCIGCGDCILGLTGGICPVTRCAKSLMNGPCGGVFKGNCEVSQSRVSKHPVPCAWILIYKKLKKLGRLDNMKKIRPARDFVKSANMRMLEVEQVG